MTGLGDAIEGALSAVGITPARVTRWLGRECGCGERKRKLNALSAWATHALRVSAGTARNSLSAVMGDEEDNEDGRGL